MSAPMEGSLFKTLALSTLLLTSCTEASDSADLECPKNSFLSYENFGDPFLLTWCTPCHSSYLTTVEDRQEAPLGVNFNTYEDVLEHADFIKILTIDTEAMPPAGGPSAEDRTLLEEWIACGLPE
jgi:uncharacterized membrane protein